MTEFIKKAVIFSIESGIALDTDLHDILIYMA
jgi:hypothetical protein